MITEIVVLVLLLVLNAYFAASEIALISLNDNKIRAMAESGHKKAKSLQNLLSEPSRFLATIQVGITLAGFLASAFAADSFSERLSSLFINWGIPFPESALKTISLVLITLIMSYFTLVFGELVPKQLGMQKSEAVAMMTVGPLTFLSKIASPVVKLLTGSTNLLVRLAGVDPNANHEQVTEEEIRMMVDVGNESGAIQEIEKTMINNIFEFNNKTVSDIMTHRSRVASLPSDLPLSEVANRVNVEKYSRFPIYEGSVDNVIGVLHTKDLIQYLDGKENGDFSLKTLIRTPYFVPTSRRIDYLYRDLQKNKNHMAIAIDEYGGTAGIVTMEDLLEEIVGNIFDEHDEEEELEIETLDEGTYLVSGMTSLRTLKEFLDIQMPYEEYDTLSGFLVGQLGRIPKPGEQPVIEFGGHVFRVQDVSDKRILRVKVARAV
ncbi:hemolysin family protein [Gorillibacterium timonense]|uniref:hemolysin family protein n=1 Tax=Gorillibacterium timonense TaxID=1689269 RepID=UPI000AF70006|nr:hemolysin family protein [Gorillibacterium timonense]